MENAAELFSIWRGLYNQVSANVCFEMVKVNYEAKLCSFNIKVYCTWEAEMGEGFSDIYWKF